MKFYFKKSLIISMCTVLVLCYVPQLFAVSLENSEIMQQRKKITGTVIDSTGEPVIGANVLEKGTSNGVITNLDGQFELNIQSGAIVEISFIGYVTQEFKIVNQSILNVTLQEDAQALDEVVVVGYGVQKKKLVTGATVQVKGDNLQKLSTTSAFTALQSQTPGVNITQSSGQPGEGFKVNIRGLGTIGNSAPLYVIDGVAGGDLNSLNPADIESIDVLKDAASAAIYGARAANGVILVTTKQGKVGKISVTYDGYIGWQNFYKMPELLNAKQYMEVMDALSFNQDNDMVYDWKSYMPEELYNSYMDGSNPGTNWMKLMRNENAPLQNHSLNVIGGNEMSKVSLGVSYTSQEGIFGKPVQSDYERTTVRLNSEHVIYRNKDFDVITLGENFFYNYNTKHGIAIGNQYDNDISNALRGVPIVPAYNNNGDFFMYDDFRDYGLFNYSLELGNPLADMYYKRGHNITKKHSLNMTAYLKIQPIKNLIFKSQFNYKMSSNSYRQYIPEYIINPQKNAQNLAAKTTQSGGQGWNYSVENTLSYIFNINRHNIDVMVGQSFEKSGMGESMSATSTNLLFQGWNYAWLTNAQSTTPTVSGSPWGEGALASFFGRVNYNYDETYMASVILRTDGSSNFARGHRWGTFPSFSAGWVISNEKFMEKTNVWLDFLKLRASWGQNGNCNIDNFQYLATVSFDNTAAYSFGDKVDGYLQGSYPDILANENISWEISEQFDIGIDARFLNNRLNVALDWYNKKTKDWLVVAPVLASMGNNAPYINGGDVENRGFELALGWNDHIGKSFTYGANINLAFNKNEITRIANSEGIIYGPTDVISTNTASIYRCEVGCPIGYFWGYNTAGVFQNQADIDDWLAAGNPTLQTKPQPGDLKFVNSNGDTIIDDDDKTMIGNPHPDYTLGLSLNFGYKGFDLSLTANGAFGHQIARSYRQFTNGRQQNYTTEVFRYWHGEGTSNKYPRLTAGNVGVNWQNPSDIFIKNADFLRMQNITFGYDFKNLWKTMPFSQVRFYVTAQNLFTITGYKGMDPEVGASGDETDYSWGSGVDLGFYPTPRTILIGVNLKF